MNSAFFTPPITAADLLDWKNAYSRVIEAALYVESAMYAYVKAGYRPDQPRDDHGRWAETGAENRRFAASTWGDPKTLERHAGDMAKILILGLQKNTPNALMIFTSVDKQRSCQRLLIKAAIFACTIPKQIRLVLTTLMERPVHSISPNPLIILKDKLIATALPAGF